MVSPSHGTPNMPLQLDSMTKSWRPCAHAAGGMMYSTRRSPPNPPVIPVKREFVCVEYLLDERANLVAGCRLWCRSWPRSQGRIRLVVVISGFGDFVIESDEGYIHWTRSYCSQ